ncbi:hypothetical protein FH972_026453 [Carpinus fangiana]|uniref:Chitin-binding type-4 domain-containing protein n=1 Tax=Carpinus fangiana TaxID=176857 RepID=A0A5N6L6J9_9ROSI|nr:hypothetical protein FH972_026453 [Carpinus fangiana]
MYFMQSTAVAALAGVVCAHMQMTQPPAIRSKFNPTTPQSLIDYSMTSPLLADGSNFPCKGYQNDRPIGVVATYNAGSTYQLELAGSATHEGGSCQLSLSYDNGKTFRVIKSMIGGCPLTPTYDFTIPDFAPNGTALFAWTWQNQVGNREFYMNCAEVAILSSTSATKLRKARSPKARRDTFSSFDQLPGIWMANLPPQNDCKTKEGDGNDPVYPHPGPDVQYSNGYSASSPVTAGTCDSLTPAGPTYQDLSTGASGSDSDPTPSTPVSGGDAGSSSSTSASAPLFTPGSPATSKVIKQTAAPSSASTTAAATSVQASPSATPLRPSTPASSAAASSATPVPSANASTKTSAQTSASTPSPSVSQPSPTAVAPGGAVVAGGSCATDGSFGCLRDGKGFAVCDHSHWTDMGSVAAGTICEGDAGTAKIVADMDAVRASSSS